MTRIEESADGFSRISSPKGLPGGISFACNRDRVLDVLDAAPLAIRRASAGCDWPSEIGPSLLG